MPAPLAVLGPHPTPGHAIVPRTSVCVTTVTPGEAFGSVAFAEAERVIVRRVWPLCVVVGGPALFLLS